MGSSTQPKPKHKPKTSRARRPRKKLPKLTAATADRYDLYQRSVNSPESDVSFLVETFRDLRGRAPRHLREDFCGTANLCAEFLSRDPKATAEGFDLDPEPMGWGRAHNFARLGAGARRMTWHQADVRNRSNRRPDVTIAANFSYWCFHERSDLVEYFRTVRDDLARDGLFVIDLYGGPEALSEIEEVREIEDGAFDYVWDQRKWEPGTGRYSTAIHFRFPDGTELREAFTYDWRFWHLTELRDVLSDAGFRKVSPYFEGTDPDDGTSGDGIFKYDPVGENCDAWIAYLVAER